MALFLNFRELRRVRMFCRSRGSPCLWFVLLPSPGLEEGNIFLRLKNKQVSRTLSKAINKKSPWRAARQEGCRGAAAFLSNVKAAAWQNQSQMEQIVLEF